MLSTKGSGQMRSIIKFAESKRKGGPVNKIGTSIALKNYGNFGAEKLVNTLNPKNLRLDDISKNIEVGLPRTADSPTRLSKK